MKGLLKFVCALAGAAAIAGAGAAQAQGIVGIATDQQGSLGYNTGAAVAKLLNLKVGIKARTQPQAGTAAYLPLIERNEMQYGYANAVESEFAYNGTGTFQGKPHPDLRLVGVMFPLLTGLMVAKDKGVETIHDLAKHKGELRIASDYTASTIIPYYIEGALANGGLKYDDFKRVPVSGFVPGMMALGEDTVDITLISLGSGASHKVNSQLRSRGGITYVSLDPSPAAEAEFKKLLPAASIVEVPANPKLPGLETPKNIVSIPWMMLTGKAVPNELVYKTTKAIAENKADLGKGFGAFNRANKMKMAPANQVPYHPGALKYFKEAGIPVGK